MAINPQPTNSPLTTVDATASTVASDVDQAISIAESMADAAIIAAAPVMNTPVWKQIWQAFIHWIFTQLASVLGDGSGFVVIDAQKYFALMNAAQALKNLNSAHQSGDPNAISQANTNANAAIAPILHFIGDIQP